MFQETVGSPMHVDSGMNSPVYKKREGSPPEDSTPVKRSRSTDESQVTSLKDIYDNKVIQINKPIKWCSKTRAYKIYKYNLLVLDIHVSGHCFDTNTGKLLVLFLKEI